MSVYCVSDLHLHSEDQPFLFTSRKEAIFARVAGEVAARGAQMVLAGDIFDLTGMTPPPEGLGDFFTAVLPGVTPLPPEFSAAAQSLAPGQLIDTVRGRFPHFFASLQPLAQAGKLTFIPGNHDDRIATDLGAQASLGEALGIPRERVLLQRSVRVAGILICAHGNQFDPTDDGDNIGRLITASFYRGVMPALAVLGMPVEVLQAIPAVRPEENIIDGIEAHIDAAAAGRLLLAFVRLLYRNHYFQGLENIELWLATHVAPGLISPARVRAMLKDDNDLKLRTRAGAQEILAGKVLATPGQPPPRAVVLGHTHELDATENYVNLGTWIDHVRGLTSADIIAADRSLPVLCIEDDGSAVLRDANTLLSMGSLDKCPLMWSFRRS